MPANSGSTGRLSEARQRLLEKRLKGTLAGPGAQGLPLEPRQDRAAPLPLSPSQQRIWFVEQMQPSPAYNICSALRLRGPLDVPAFARALNEVIRRHEALRTTFVLQDGAPVQLVVPELTLELPLVDLRGLPREQREPEALRAATRQARQTFDLTRPGLLRANLLRLDEREHLLVLVMHHIISDGWSMGVLLQEFMALYAAFVRGAPSGLPELRVQYGDFTLWQRRWLEGPEPAAQLDYWRKQLGGTIPVTQLPTDRPRPPVQSFRGALHHARWPKGLVDGLKALSQQRGSTLFMTLLAAYQALIHRYTEQSDILIGSVVANRNRTETEALIGCFINTLALRTDASGDPRFVELLDRVREVCLKAFAHQEVPFERVVEELRPERDLSRPPFFQLGFALQSAPMPAANLTGLEASFVEVDGGTSKFDVTLWMFEQQGELAATFEYNTDLFEAETIARLAESLRRLLEGVVEGPEQRLSELPLLPAREQHRLLVEWNDTAVPFPEDRCIHQLFEEQARRTPDATAAVSGGDSLTYREVEEQANQLARFLRGRHGLGPDDLVGVMIARSHRMPVYLLGILKAGAAFVPVDPEYPESRIRYILDDSRVRLLITEQELVRAVPELACPVLAVDAEWPRIAAEARAPLPPLQGPGHLAYAIYTSGSTGNPKGVAIQHRSAVNLFMHFKRSLRLTPEDRFAQQASLSFDFALGETFPVLLAGATLVVIGKEVALEPERVLEVIARERITGYCTFPVIISMINERGLERVPSLRLLFSGGDLLTFAQLEHLAPRIAMINAYGPTETTIYSTHYDFKSPRRYGPNVPIGRPVDNNIVYVLDAGLRLRPAGVPGELYIGGEGLARGYLAKPALTAEKFIPNPFRPGERMYRTGDLARWLPDGNVEFLGRRDDQVKIRGCRIELGEIEDVLARCPGVQEGLVLVRDAGSGDKQLVAYVLPQPGQPLNGAQVRSFVQQHLPSFMTPSAVVVMARWPITPNGKVDRRALPPPDEAAGPQRSRVEPRTPLETSLRDIWASLLGVPTLGVTDNFFDLGGHSMLAVRLFAQVKTRLGVELPLSTLFRYPTIELLAGSMEQREKSPASPLVELQPQGSRPPLFLVHPAGGTVFCYADLAAGLGPGQPVLGLQARGLAPGEEPLQTVEAMASAYLQAVRERQPKGPYLLGGWSLGGVVAYEMAQQLRAAGEEVALLALIDAYAQTAGTVSSDRDVDAFVTELFAQDLGGLLQPDARLPAEELRGLQPEERLARVVQWVQGTPGFTAHAAAHQVERLLRVFQQNVRALWSYQPRPYPGPALLLRATETVELEGKITRAWNELVPSGLQVHDVPATHYTLMRAPGLGQVLHHLQQQLVR